MKKRGDWMCFWKIRRWTPLGFIWGYCSRVGKWEKVPDKSTKLLRYCTQHQGMRAKRNPEFKWRPFL